MKNEIFLVRHGETVWNTEGRYQGTLNTDLTANGKAQAATVGRILARVLGDKTNLPLYVSPLGRTLETAEILQKEVTFSDKIVEKRIQEVGFGDWEGKRIVDVLAENPKLSEEINNSRGILCAPNAEPYSRIVTRLASWMADLRGPTVAVSHGVISRIIRGIYLGIPKEESLKLPIQQNVVWHLKEGSVTLLEDVC